MQGCSHLPSHLRSQVSMAKKDWEHGPGGRERHVCVGTSKERGRQAYPQGQWNYCSSLIKSTQQRNVPIVRVCVACAANPSRRQRPTDGMLGQQSRTAGSYGARRILITLGLRRRRSTRQATRQIFARCGGGHSPRGESSCWIISHGVNNTAPDILGRKPQTRFALEGRGGST